MSPSKAQVSRVGRTPTLLTTCFDSGHLQHKRERPDMEWKYMNSDKATWKKLELTTLTSKVGGATLIQSKPAFCNVNSYRRSGLSPRRPNAGVATDFDNWVGIISSDLNRISFKDYFKDFSTFRISLLSPSFFVTTPGKEHKEQSKTRIFMQKQPFFIVT